MSEECETINATLTGDQRDALQEIANIGMGQAGSSIARIWGEFVRLSIPRIANVERLDIPTVLQQLVGEKNILAVRQAFHGQIRGEVIIVFSGGPPRELAELMGYDDTDRVERLIAYCRQDVAATLDCWFRLQPLSIDEERVYRADSKINERGVWLDQEFAGQCSRCETPPPASVCWLRPSALRSGRKASVRFPPSRSP